MALSSKVAIPLNEHGRSFNEFTILPVSDLKGPKKFNAFITFCNHSENHAVLVSRAFPSTSIALQGEYLAIRQVHFIAATTSSTSTEYSMYKHCPLSLYTLGQLGIFFRSWTVPCWLASLELPYLRVGYSVDFLRLEGYQAGKLRCPFYNKLTIQYCTTTINGSLLLFFGVQVKILKFLIRHQKGLLKLWLRRLVLVFVEFGSEHAPWCSSTRTGFLPNMFSNIQTFCSFLFSSHFFSQGIGERFTRIWPRQRDAFCIRNWEWGPFWLCAEKQDVPPTNEGSDHNTKVQSDIVAADILQSNIQLTGDTDLVPEVEDINKDMDAIEEQLLEQSASTQQQNSQVTSFILKLTCFWFKIYC